MKKIALIGVGKMGLSHLAIANQTPGLAVKAICDKSKTLLRFAEKNTHLRCFSDYLKMLQEVDLDGVLVCVPSSLHFQVVKDCMEKRLHVFVEKPFTLKFEQSKRLVNLEEKYGVKGQVGYVNRFNLIFQRVKSLLADQVIGEVNSYTNKMVGAVITKENSKGWRNDYSQGGGCLYDYGPHCFDLSTYFFGTEVEVKSAVLKRIFSSKVDDMVASVLQHGTVTGFNYVNWSESSVRKASNSIEIFGSNGKIVANKQELSLFLTKENPGLSLKKGWNQLFITDENTDVDFYLRGEEFSLQLIEFSQLLNGKKEKSIASFYEASVIDRLIEEMLQKSNGLQ